MTPSRFARVWLCLAAAVWLGGCFPPPLTADAPLFSTADQVGPPPLREGVWLSPDECDADWARASGRAPPGCWFVELRHRPDGAWLWRVHDDEMGFSEARLIMAPVTGASSAEAPTFYIWELSPIQGRQWLPPPYERTSYLIIAPIGTRPAREMAAAEILCPDKTISGIKRGARSCIADHPAAVREAARHQLSDMAFVTGASSATSSGGVKHWNAHLVWVGP